jgi:hypothetical protein
MTTEQPTAQPTFEELDALDTETLRERAFHAAWHHRDFGFFKSVIEHLPASVQAEGLDGSFGAVGPELSDIVEVWRELRGHDYGDEEPILRATFIDYLMKQHG